MGSDNIIHPLVEIKQENGAGPIIIGHRNIFNEHCLVHNTRPEPLVIGSDNYFQTGCVIQGNIGNHCSIGVKAIIQPGVVLGNGVVLNATIRMTHSLPDHTILYGKECRIFEQQPDPQLLKHRQYLNETLPLYHHTDALSP